MYLLMTGFVMASASLAASLPVSAKYPNPIVRFKVSDLGHFDTVLPALAKQGRVAIVCEGQPLHLDLPSDQVQQLEQRIDPGGMPLEDAVKWVAAAYDYKAQRTGVDMFVLTKRYTYADDLPDVPFEEANASLQNILKATTNFSPSLSLAKSVLEILRASSPDQRAKLAQGISVLSLSDDQRQGMISMVKSIVFRPLFSIDRIAQRLQGFQKPSADFTFSQLYGQTFPVCEGQLGPYAVPYSIVLSGWIQTQPGNSSGDPEGVELVNGKLISSPPGQMEPTAPRPPDQIPVAVTSPLRHTLAEEAKQLTARLTKSHILLIIQTDPFLVAKTVCLAGETNAAPSDIATALAAVYGLEIKSDAHVETLVMPQPIVLNDAQSVPAEVKRLLPAPFLSKVKALDPEEGFPTEQSPKLLALAGSATENGGDKDLSLTRASTLYIAAVRRLRERIEPQIKAMPNQKLPVSNTDAEVHSCFALMSMAICLIDFHNLSQPPTPYVSNFDKATLTLSQDKTNPTFIGFSVEAPDGHGGGAAVSGNVGWSEFRQYAP